MIEWYDILNNLIYLEDKYLINTEDVLQNKSYIYDMMTSATIVYWRSQYNDYKNVGGKDKYLNKL